MRLVVFALLIMAFAGAAFPARAQQTAPAQAAADPRLTAEERAKLVQWLNDTQKEYLDRLEHVSDAQWHWRPAPFRWTVGEVAEHIMLTEGRLFGAVQGAMASPINPNWQTKTTGKDTFIERAVPSRAVHVQAPLEIRPTGKLSREEVIQRFKEQRARIMELVQKTNEPLKAHTLEHPMPVFNTLNAYDWLVYIPMHTERHLKQMAEVIGSPGYPQ